MSAVAPAQRSLLATVLFSSTLLGLTVWMFYPGYLTWDAAYQWYQVRTGHWDNVHPMVMTLIWSATDLLLPGPGGYFLFQIALYWSGLALLAMGLYRSTSARLAAVLFLGLFPPVFALLPHLLKDVGLLVFLIWAVALLIHDRRTPSRLLRGAALVLIAIACAYRHNALPIALPLVWYLTAREPTLAPYWRRRLAATVVVTLVITLVSAIPNRMSNVAQRQVWPITAIWDLAAVSIIENDMLLPEAIIDPDLSIADLKAHWAPYAAVPVFGSGKIRDSVTRQAFDARQTAAVNRAWLNLWLNHFPAYMAHRLHVTELLFGLAPRELPDTLIIDYTVTALADNPPIVSRQNRLQALWYRLITPLLDSPVFSFWPYAIVLFVLAVFARMRDAVHPLLTPILWSALLLTAPLLVIAPGADFRFLLWPVFCAALGITLAMSEHHASSDGT